MGQYTKNVQFNGDPNPNGDNYVWEDINGALTAGWVVLNDNQSTGEAVFTINPWTNNPSGTRTAAFQVRHWMYDPGNPIDSLVDSFLITQYADSSAVVTTTEAATSATAAIYTITYNANGGAGTTPSTSGPLPLTVANNNFTRAGWTFNNWHTESSGSGSGQGMTYDEGAAYNVESNDILYAQWYETPTTNATTPATNATTPATNATTQPTYTVTIGANSSIANAAVYNVASGGQPNNTLTRTGVAGSSFADAFYIEANSGYNISPSQVSITSWGGGGTNYYVDPNVNSAGRVVVGFSDQIDPNNLSIEIAFTGSVSQITYTAQVHESDSESTICDQTTANSTFTYPQGQGGANFQNYFLNNYGVSGNSGFMKIISSNEPNFAWSGWAIGMNDDNESTGGWFNCANQTTTSSGGGSGTSGGGSGQTTVIPSSVNISGEEWIYTMGGPEDYTATVTNLSNPTYSWSVTGLHQNKFLLSNATSQTCTLEYIWTSDCSGGGQDIDLNVSVTGTNSQGQTVTVGDVKGVNGCDDSAEDDGSS